jgi:hypothetical protein
MDRYVLGGYFMPEENKKIYEVTFKQVLDVEKGTINTRMVDGEFLGDDNIIKEMAEAYKNALNNIKKEQGGE